MTKTTEVDVEVDLTEEEETAETNKNILKRMIINVQKILIIRKSKKYTVIRHGS